MIAELIQKLLELIALKERVSELEVKIAIMEAEAAIKKAINAAMNAHKSPAPKCRFCS